MDKLEQTLSLFPMSPEEQRSADAKVIRQILLNERYMREKVFRDNTPVRLRKVAEIDLALAALDRLEMG